VLLGLVSLALAQDAGAIGGIAGGISLTTDPMGGVVVGRVGAKLVPVFDVEVELAAVTGDPAPFASYDPRLNLVLHATPDQRADFFLVGGAGVRFADGAFDPDPVIDVGPGVTVAIAGPVHARADVRWFGTIGPPFDAIDTLTRPEITIGVDFRGEAGFDLDHDGIPNSRDTCPGNAEDKDGFLDSDGCPDNDNDDDTIADANDKCPMDAEDRDGFADTDGCPDPDNDNDTVPDKQDRCVGVAEDRDGFEDDDGCPEVDNDQDALDDPVDKCPDEAEIFNGFDDADGCPDDIPADLKKFTGVIRGITFETNKAIIRPSSETTLNEALVVLQKYKTVRLEVQGHTDDVGGDDFNFDLSQRRAEAVVAWFVDHGVEAGRLVAHGYGKTVPVADNSSDAGRAENRRVEFKLLTNR
jgi:OOP family OmpA-OmpF porin